MTKGVKIEGFPPKASKQLDNIIDFINLNDFGWKANECLKTGAKCNSTAQTTESQALEFGKGEGFKAAVEEAQKFRTKYQSSEEI